MPRGNVRLHWRMQTPAIVAKCLRRRLLAMAKNHSDEAPIIRLGISACLLGQPVRHDGGHKREAFLVDTLGAFVKWVPVCPEVEIGMGTPRETIRLEGNVDAPRLIATKSGVDHTNAMKRWSKQRLRHWTSSICMVLSSSAPHPVAVRFASRFIRKTAAHR